MPRRAPGAGTGWLVSAVLLTAVLSAAGAGGVAPAAAAGLKHVSSGQEFASALSDFRVRTVLINGAHARACTGLAGAPGARRAGACRAAPCMLAACACERRVLLFPGGHWPGRPQLYQRAGQLAAAGLPALA